MLCIDGWLHNFVVLNCKFRIVQTSIQQYSSKMIPTDFQEEEALFIDANQHQRQTPETVIKLFKNHVNWGQKSPKQAENSNLQKNEFAFSLLKLKSDISVCKEHRTGI